LTFVSIPNGKFRISHISYCKNKCKKNNGNDVCNQSVTQKKAKEYLEYKAAVRVGKADYKQVVI